MKISVFDKYLGYNVGGAQKSLHALLKESKLEYHFFGCNVVKSFSAYKHKIDGFNVKRINIIEISRFPYIEYFLNRRRAIKFIRTIKSDILITQGMWGAIAARFFKGKVIYFIRDEYHFNELPVYQKGIKKILKYIYLLVQLPFILIFFRDNKNGIKKVYRVISNSKYVSAEIERRFNRPSDVIYPIISVRDLLRVKLQEDERKYITCIGQELIKGREIVEKIAAEMTDLQFMIVGRNILKPLKKNNILYFPWKDDVLDIYKKTKLLLIPSICNEAFGRTAVEAISLSIPVIGSNKGGLVEVLDEKNLIKDVYDIQSWKDKISFFLNKKNNIHNYRDKALLFDMENQIRFFNEILRQ
ncbi:MAG: glycosyltransferase family 4 protein [bacterium]